jgi:hypothetical protein
MIAGSISDSDAIEIIEHLLAFSKVYFAAFRMPRDRIRFWRFLLLVLRIERESLGKPIRGHFSTSEVQGVLGATAKADNVRHWRQWLVSHFREPDGMPFLEDANSETSAEYGQQEISATNAEGHRPRGAPRKLKFYKFSNAFNAPASKYVEGLLIDVMKLQALATNFRAFPDDLKTQTFKSIIQFIEETYYPLWITFVGDAAKAAGPAGRSKRFKSALVDHTPYWVITMLTWRQMLQRVHPPLTERNYKADVETALREVERTEVETALMSMIDWKLLHCDEKGGHYLDAVLEPELRKYVTAIWSARERFAAFLHSKLGDAA